MQRKRPVLELYTQCLRSARRCPQWEQREIMRLYVKTKFRDEVHVKDRDRVRALLIDGREELERMNYYHSIYEAKQRGDKTGGAVTADTTQNGCKRPPFCRQCQAAYPSKQANFCANCGIKRPESS